MSTKKEITKTICRKLAFSSEDVNDNFITIKLLLEKNVTNLDFMFCGKDLYIQYK